VVDRFEIERGRAICLALVVVGSVASVLLRMHAPLLLLPPGPSGHDDGLFIRQASNIVAGNWLGPFDDLTLAKGPAFPAFIAAMHGLRLPLMLGTQVTVLLAALALAAAVWVVSRRDWLATATFLIVALDPINFSFEASRVIRDNWYAAVTTLFVCILFLAVYGVVRARKFAGVLALGALGGLCGGVFWLCREEGPWIIPSVLIVTLAIPLGLYLRWRRMPAEGRPSEAAVRSRALRTAAVLLAALVGFAAPIEIVRAENDSHYGTTLTNDVASGEVARAYADWSRVRAGPLVPRVPFSKAQRQAVYAVSPAARELRSYMEDPHNPWIAGQCLQGKLCGDFGGAVEMWALRDAAAASGHFSSATAAQGFFGRVDDQIEAGCESGRLDCATRLPVPLQPLQRTSLGSLTDSFTGAMGDLFASRDLYRPVHQAPALTPADRDTWRRIVAGVPPTQAASDQDLQEFTAGDWIYDTLDFIYRFLLVPVLFGVALVGVAVSLRFPRWPRVALLVLALALAVGVLARLGLLAMVDTTQFDAREPQYEFPARAFLLAFACVGSALLVEALSARARPRSPSSP
jgi:hypothetical protein